MTGPLHMLGASHRTAPVEIREKIAVSPERTATLYEGLRNIRGLNEFAVLNTCNRVEIYAVAPEPEVREKVLDFVSDFHRFDRETLLKYSAWKENEDAVSHLFEVASGVDSLVVGEAEILGQVKESYEEARRHACMGPVLNRLFQKSFQAAKWTRTHTGIGRGQVSVGSVAVDLAGKIFGDLERCRILVLGAGEIAERTIVNLKNRGARSVTLSNRTFERAGELAGKLEGTVLRFEQFKRALGDFDIVIGSTAASAPVITRKEAEEIMHHRPLQPIFLIDLAVPRDFDPEIAQVDNIFLYNIDDLSQIADANRSAREGEIRHCREVLERKARHVWKHLRLRAPAQRQPKSVQARIVGEVGH